ncbi:hypothetical protein ABIF65_008100 [Bradyrhizobium japonicum]|jgi:hypothetical protein|nr:hypothetical protein [Bradyrhizobium japonicum]MCP1773774.1 hypothetical protein [Bradyrhizobium japonicum]MCP1863995.1 hypothetical protein [Bradyrhizobium japonicum]MCP1894582.1 hypothetical protein [Bradyrhizobium japonicum]MCP1963226.1 hypothetical protein [Bradyrhizobium japonicum]
MRFSPLFAASRAVAVSSMTLLLYGLSGTAMSQAATPSGRATSSLHNVVVEAPEQAARPHKPKQHAVARSTVSSFQPGNKPWVGCSASAGSTICRNVYNYKTYAACTQAGVRMGWNGTESYGYCSALALKE